MTARVWEIPVPLTESPKRLMLSIQAAYGMALDDQAVADSLTPAAWWQRGTEYPEQPASS